MVLTTSSHKKGTRVPLILQQSRPSMHKKIPPEVGEQKLAVLARIIVAARVHAPAAAVAVAESRLERESGGMTDRGRGRGERQKENQERFPYHLCGRVRGRERERDSSFVSKVHDGEGECMTGREHAGSNDSS